MPLLTLDIEQAFINAPLIADTFDHPQNGPPIATAAAQQAPSTTNTDSIPADDPVDIPGEVFLSVLIHQLNDFVRETPTIGLSSVQELIALFRSLLQVHALGQDVVLLRAIHSNDQTSVVPPCGPYIACDDIKAVSHFNTLMEDALVKCFQDDIVKFISPIVSDSLNHWSFIIHSNSVFSDLHEHITNSILSYDADVYFVPEEPPSSNVNILVEASDEQVLPLLKTLVDLKLVKLFEGGIHVRQYNDRHNIDSPSNSDDCSSTSYSSADGFWESEARLCRSLVKQELRATVQLLQDEEEDAESFSSLDCKVERTKSFSTRMIAIFSSLAWRFGSPSRYYVSTEQEYVVATTRSARCSSDIVIAHHVVGRTKQQQQQVHQRTNKKRSFGCRAALPNEISTVWDHHRRTL